MAKTLRTLFLWHMHQPPYGDPMTGKAIMPWVRLHAAKGYLDMGSVLEEFPGVRVTFNFSPSLLMQLDSFDDLFLDYTMKPAADLTPGDQEFLLANFFLCYPETMIRPYPRYWELFKKRGKRTRGEHVRTYLASFSGSDLLDLQVWFNLTWFGFTAVDRDPNLGDLRRKGRDFTEEDKAYVIDAQRKILREIIPLYKRLQDRGQIEISLSPYFHPILPLLYDTDLARRTRPGIHLPPRFNHPEDARAQIDRALTYGEQVFGRRPGGMWPSEGSVSPEVASLMADAGVVWAATDEAILIKSKPGKRNALLYSPYAFSTQGKRISLVFRDRALSDAISYSYCRQPAEDAVRDFTRRLEAIRSASEGSDPVATVILDGENPWEYYPSSGKMFLRGLYRSLSEGPVRTETPSGYLADHWPVGTLSHLATGSWIEANFDIWIGQDEDNLGWEYLRKTRDFLTSYLSSHPDVPKDVQERAWDHIYRAEGSDWFWWYGDQFSTEQDKEFDHLFRSHLMSVYHLLTGDWPQFLQQSICTEETAVPATLPTSFVAPKMDGEVTSYYEWFGAGVYTPGGEGAVRYRGAGLFARLLYGFDRGNFYLCLEPVKGRGLETLEGLELHVHILHGVEHKAEIPISSPVGSSSSFKVYRTDDGVTFTDAGDLTGLAVKKVIEMAFPFAHLGLHAGEKVFFVIEVKDRDREIDRYPRQGFISFVVPSENFEREMWKV